MRSNNTCDGARGTFLTAGDGTCESYGSCGGADVVLCTIQGGGHTWPGGAPRLAVLPECEAAGEGGQSTTFIASEHIWDFFARFAL